MENGISIKDVVLSFLEETGAGTEEDIEDVRLESPGCPPGKLGPTGKIYVTLKGGKDPLVIEWGYNKH